MVPGPQLPPHTPQCSWLDEVDGAVAARLAVGQRRSSALPRTTASLRCRVAGAAVLVVGCSAALTQAPLHESCGITQPPPPLPPGSLEQAATAARNKTERIEPVHRFRDCPSRGWGGVLCGVPPVNLAVHALRRGAVAPARTRVASRRCDDAPLAACLATAAVLALPRARA